MIRLRDILTWQFTSNPTRVIIRKPSQMRSRRQLLLVGGIMGILPTVYWLCLMVGTDSNFRPIGWDFGPGIFLMYSIFGNLGVVAIYHGAQWSHFKRIREVGISACMSGIASCVFLLAVCAICSGFRMFDDLEDLLSLLGCVIGCGLAYAAGAIVFWSMAKWHNHLRGVFVVVQEATCCAACGFDLSGKQSTACPSCGTAFTLESLRTPNGLSAQSTVPKAEA